MFAECGSPINRLVAAVSVCIPNKKGIADQPNRLYTDVSYKERGGRNNNREDGGGI